MALDVRSLWIISALCSCCLGALVLVVRKSYPAYLTKELVAWGAAYLSLGLGFAVFFAQPWVGPAVFHVLGPTLVVLGISLSYHAITELKRQPSLTVWLIGPPLLVFAECILFTFAKPNTTIELFIFNTVNLVLLIRISLALIRGEKHHQPFIDTLAGFSYAALAGLGVIALLDFLLAGGFSTKSDYNNPRTIITSIVAIVAEGILFSLFLLVVGERVNRDLKVQALHDPLTGLYNRRAFEEIALHEVSGAARTRKPLAVLMFDIDHFKRINDQYGHSTGDAVLKAAAEILGRSVRNEDFLCRWGGEEFCALLPRATHAQARDVAERALRAFEASPIQVGGRQIQITVSIGIASESSKCQEFSSLVELADTALYQAKEKGRNRFATA